MTSISLRSYHNDIEKLIDQGLIDEAIAHCRYILSTYPKCIATYKVLAKAYLENKNYTEAQDLFSRVISVFPDDFVSHVGMSIVQEDAGNLDAAIWHMELAYDLQPTNLAVQEELRRLFGRRDGVQPKKIGLTRGALIRMYGRGELYHQAIAEILSVIEEDPKRIDLEVVLARMYYQSGSFVEATEVCSRLLNRFPYIYEANLILTNILPKTAQAESTRIYLERLINLDPYFQFVTSPDISVDSVADEKIQLEKLIFTPGEDRTFTKHWASNLNLDWEKEDQEQKSDWLSGIDALQESSNIETSPVESPIKSDLVNSDEGTEKPSHLEEEQSPNEISGSSSQEIPDWMREAGWMPSSGESVSEPSYYESENETENTEQPIPADLPDWLKEFVPGKETEQIKLEETSSFQGEIPNELNPEIPYAGDVEPITPEADETLIELSGTLTAWTDHTQNPQNSLTPEKAGENMFSDNSDIENSEWLNQLRSNSSGSNESAEEPDDNLPDWLKGFEEKQPSEQEEDLPDWLKSLQTEENMPISKQEPQPAISSEEKIAREPEPQINPAETSSAENLDRFLGDRSKLFTKILNEQEGSSEQENTGYLQPESHPLPNDWEKEVAKEEEAIEQSAAESQPPSDIPEWVRNALKLTGTASTIMPEERTPSQQIEQPLPLEETGESPIFEMVEKNENLEDVTGAISEETNNELLDWLRSINTEEPVEGSASTEVGDELQAESLEGNVDFSLVDRLDTFGKPATDESAELEKSETINEIPSETVISFIRDSQETVQEESVDTGYPNATLDVTEETIPEPEKPVLDTEISPIPTVPESGMEIAESISDPLENINVLLEEGKFDEMASAYSSLMEKKYDLALIEESIRSNIDKYPDRFELWQILGDVLARSNHLEDALTAYEKAESILLQNINTYWRKD